MHLDVLGDAVIVIAADGVRGMFAHPLQARSGLKPIVYKIAKDKARVEGLVDRFQSGPVRVDVRQEQNPHEIAASAGRCQPAGAERNAG
jgi:hypothetical protein